MMLNHEQQTLIDELMASGRFDSPDQVIDTALRLLTEQTQDLAHLKAEIQKGYDSGPSIPAQQVFAELRQKLNDDLNRG